MSIDITMLRGFATLSCLIAYSAIVIWAYSSHNKKKFHDAAQLPFADDTVNTKSKDSQEAPHG